MSLREILSAKIAAIPEKPIAVATSGGIDSSALVLAALDAGKKVTVASFSFSHESSDFKAARALAKTFDLFFLPVLLQRNEAAIAHEVRHLIEAWGVRKKAAVECLWPFLAAIRTVKGAGLDSLVVGSAADGHFALSKKAMIHHRYPKEKFQAFRKAYFENPDAAQVATLGSIGAASGVRILAPYHSREVFDVYSDSSWDDLNKPRQKEAIRREFPELDALKIARHTNLQLGDSRIAEVVGAAAIATYAPGAKSAVAAYNEVARRFCGQA
jgi:asparagine synthetase B (glutamine-hydrolysing)